jgi:WD40 repeat protein
VSTIPNSRRVFGASGMRYHSCQAPCESFHLCLYDLATRKVEFELSTSEFPISSAASPDGTQIAVGVKRGTVLLFDVNKRAVVRELKDASTGVFGLDYSPDGALLAAASYDRALRLYDTRTWTQRTLGFHEHGIRSVKFSPDGALLVTGGYDRLIRLWSVKDREELAVMKGHEDTVRSIAFSPDGQVLASAAWDGTVRLWDVRSHTELARYVSNDLRVNSVQFSPDGRTLFYAGVRPYRLAFPELSSPSAALEQTLALTGFELRGTALVRKR